MAKKESAKPEEVSEALKKSEAKLGRTEKKLTKAEVKEAEMAETYGDTNSVDCPKCGKPIRDLWDMGDDLIDGAEIHCPHCEYPIKVLRVETIHEVTLIG